MTRSPRRWLQLAALLILAPVCAEYLSAYDDSTGHPVTLVGNLIIFIPLYGCAALLIREVARRAHLGWPGMIVLAAAFGILQAGVFDQSLFSPTYRGLAGWDTMYTSTLIPGIGMSAYNALTFVGGHVVSSICAPIALIEAIRPQSATQPWLRVRGVIVVGGLWLGASVLVLRWHLQTETWHAGNGQLTGAVVVALALVVAAVLSGRGSGRATPDHRPAPSYLVAGGGVVILAAMHAMSPTSWLGVVKIIIVLLGAAVIIRRWSTRTGWTPTHMALVGAAPLLVTAVFAFTYDPMIGEVSTVQKYGHNVAMLIIVLGVTGLAVMRSERTHAEPEAVEAPSPTAVNAPTSE